MRKLLPILLVLPLLSACEKPVPTVTVASVGGSVRAEPICWSRTSATPIGEECRLDSTLVGSLEVTPGEFVGISVDKQVAESGWVVSVNGRRITESVVTKPYYRFDTFENSFASGPLEIEVYALTDDDKARGVWAFTLTDR